MNELINAIELKDGKAVTTSLKIAEIFEKDHDKVIRTIESLQVPDNFKFSNFGVLEIPYKNGHAEGVFDYSRRLHDSCHGIHRSKGDAVQGRIHRSIQRNGTDDQGIRRHRAPDSGSHDVDALHGDGAPNQGGVGTRRIPAQSSADRSGQRS